MAIQLEPRLVPVERQAYSIPEFATIFGIPVRTGYAAAQRGDIKTIRFGSRIVVPATEVQRLLKVAPPGPSVDAENQDSERGASLSHGVGRTRRVGGAAAAPRADRDRVIGLEDREPALGRVQRG